MKTYKSINIPSQVASTVQCDVCKRIYDLDAANDDIMEVNEFLNVKFVCGYNSVFGDLNRVECDICQHCLKEKLGEFLRIT